MPRYIDADMLKKELMDRKDSANRWYADARVKDDEEIMIRADSAVASFIECILTLNKIPTADVQEVKYGKWLAIGNTGLASCSCGFITDRYYVYNYCPNCGADMRKETDGETVYRNP